MSENAPENTPKGRIGPALALPETAHESLKRRERRYRRRGFREDTKAFAIFKSQDWPALREEFFTARLDTGEWAHRSLTAFIHQKFEDLYERKVAFMLLGRKPTRTVPWLGDWAAERVAERVRSHVRLKTLAAALERETELAAVAGPMSELFLDCVGRIQNWSDELEEATGGRLLSDGTGQADLAMAERLLRMMQTAMGCLMDARGGKDVLVMQMAARASNPYQSEPGEARQREIFVRVMQTAWERHKEFGIALPELPEADRLAVEAQLDGEAAKRKE